MTDGFAARKTHSESKRGAMLDSIADIIFLLAVVYKLLFAVLNITAAYVIVFAVVIAAVRIAAYIVGAVKFRRFVSLHTCLNKITGAALFLSVYFLFLPDINTIFTVVCIIAAISSIEELLIDIKSKTYNPEIKTIFCIHD